jgi:DNA polymerase family B
VQDADAYKATAAHVELAKKMMKRDSATAPTVGDRVAFVIVKGAKGAKASDKAEDPIFVLENNLPIDAQHYLEHHLTQPLMRIFEPIMGEKKAKSLLSGAQLPACPGAAPCAWLHKQTVALPRAHGLYTSHVFATCGCAAKRVAAVQASTHARSR